MFVLFRKPFVYGLTIKGYFNAIVKQHHQSNVVTCNDSIFIQFHLNEKTKLLTAHLIFKMKDDEGLGRYVQTVFCFILVLLNGSISLFIMPQYFVRKFHCTDLRCIMIT